MTEKKMREANSYLEGEGEIIEYFEVDGYEFYIVQEEDINEIQDINDEMIKEYCEEHNIDYNNVDENKILQKIGDDELSQAYSDRKAVGIHLHWDSPVPEEILEKAENEF